MGFKVSALLSAFMLTYLLTAVVFTSAPTCQGKDSTRSPKESCGIWHQDVSNIQEPYPMSLVVSNPYSTPVNLTFTTDIAYRGILLGAMRKIQEKNQNFTFTTEENPDYGPFLVSVNGVPGSAANHTYWELLVTLLNGTTFRPDVGVGCYIPNPHDTVILKYSTWKHEEASTVL
ncbi:hypothetical protein QTP70_024934 [Hemibagrus guttatus]|uniref:Transcobalamin-like C-terminal domain-containing protein n=1 Tax=Hemibagrus guttatus TaxID=175788 RepID=A0AAE0QSZ0_9TELE|nr:hypothetical protein QTP70_024934 [Hemibagrus guttatus]